jgi:SAM-dependent methyltransferase
LPAHTTNRARATNAGTVTGASRSDPLSLAVIVGTIIAGVANPTGLSTDPAQLARFYEDGYSTDASRAALYARWRALGALAKADHAIDLCARAGVRPASTLDVGCGDGALLCELHRRGFGGRLAGVEISAAAVSIARQREQIDSVEPFDGQSLPAPNGSYDLGVLCHVLEHVPDPAPLLQEVGRVCRAVLIEVPLEANLSARRSSKRRHAAEVGHLQRLDRGAMRRCIERAGLSVACELTDPLGLETQRFFAASTAARSKATATWAARAGLHRTAPFLARRLFTVHYACLCLPGG